MTQLIRQSLTAYAAPLCVTVAEVPEPVGSEVVVRIRRCGVCHSDVHLQDGYPASHDRRYRAGLSLDRLWDLPGVCGGR